MGFCFKSVRAGVLPLDAAGRGSNSLLCSESGFVSSVCFIFLSSLLVCLTAGFSFIFYNKKCVEASYAEIEK